MRYHEKKESLGYYCCHERCFSFWLGNKSRVNCLSHNCVTIGWCIATFWQLYCWSSSGDGVGLLCVSISSTMLGNDWCILVLAWVVVDWRISIFVIQTRDCSLGGLHWYLVSIVLTLLEFQSHYPSWCCEGEVLNVNSLLALYCGAAYNNRAYKLFSDQTRHLRHT